MKASKNSKVKDKRSENFSKFVKGVMERYVKAGKYTPEEKVFENILLEAGLKRDEDFYHNYKFKSDRGRYFWVDFFLPKWNLIVEIDGGIWHKFFKQAMEKDMRRDSWLRSFGFEIIRIDSEKLRGSIESINEVKSMIYKKLGIVN
ncbi:MAG: DUF559 domain-containing protein [Candidatus Methanomethylicia archaeon]